MIFGFSTPVGKYNVLGALIRFVSKRKFSHSYVRFVEPMSKSSIVFQASGLSVNMVEYSNFLTKEVTIEEYTCDVSDSYMNPMLEYMLSQVGTNYGLFQLFLDLFYIVFNVKLPFRSTGEVCSEQSARLAQVIGLNIPGDLSYCTPSDLQKFCATNMKKVI